MKTFERNAQRFETVCFSIFVRSRSILMQDTAKKFVYRGENVTKMLGVPRRTW